MLVILSGVSGAGKDTIKKELIKREENIVTIPSFTDRPMRTNDVEGGTYHFVSTEEFETVKILDPMTEERNTLRYSLLYSLKEIYLYNKARNNTNISIFEVGKGFYKEDGEYKEDLKLAGLMTGDYYLDITNSKVDFYTVKVEMLPSKKKVA